MNYEKLMQKMTEARKNRDGDKVLILSTIIGELALKAEMVDGKKAVTDEMVVKGLKRYVAGLQENAALVGGWSDAAKRESIIVGELLVEFLPEQLTIDALRQLKEWLGDPTLPEFMKHLKENYAGQYDGKMASEVGRE